MSKLNPESEKWFVIVNPVAARGKAGKAWPKIEARLKGLLPEWQHAFTQGLGHGIQLADEAIQSGYRHLLAVGGDGTNNEVVNGIMGQKLVASDQITYAFLPIGTGNDWIKSHGIPKGLDQWILMFQQGNTTTQDIGLVYYYYEGQEKKRYFANVAGLAYDAFVVRYAANHRGWMLNHIFYLMMIMRCLFMYRLCRARVLFDHQMREDRYYTINVGICKYSGGGMSLVPHAVSDDGLLALTLAGPITKLSVLLNTYRFYNDSIGDHPQVETFQVKELEILPSGITPTLLEVDGEFLGETPVRFEIIPSALRIVVP
ncbi:MAG: diacylglycerol kinase [Saprospiraceae bacterium]|nr:MAG: diacylglycerol kinase [Saprospiraceae bacterium]